MKLIDADKGLISKIQRETGCNFITAQKIVDSMPTVEERKVGKWIEVWESQRDEFSGEYDEWREHKCSICDFQEMDAARFNFCPNCGAEMVCAENE